MDMRYCEPWRCEEHKAGACRTTEKTPRGVLVYIDMTCRFAQADLAKDWTQYKTHLKNPNERSNRS